MYICLCKAVTDTRIKEAIRAGCKSVRMVGGFCYAGMDCGSCGMEIKSIIEAELEAQEEKKEVQPFTVIEGGAGNSVG